MKLAQATSEACREILGGMLEAARAPRLRSMRAFAEAEIVLPDSGPYAGGRYRCEYQPYSRLWFDAIGTGAFNRFAATGPSQSGKTLTALVIPLLYHLFERRETVILFGPTMPICEAKWYVDILPTIKRSRFAEMLPTSGRGSQGGFSDLICMSNGAILKSMSAGGGDSSKAAFTAKAAFGTEIDGMDQASETSNESDPINQIAARLRAHGQAARMYLECTVTNPRGRIWTEYKGGTCSRIVLQCPHCEAWVSPEREQFVAWDTAATELQAEEMARFSCPECGGIWSPEQRISANHSAKLVHAGQEVTPDGEIVGAMPETRTFSLRWSAVNNLFATERQIGGEEFKSSKEIDRENAEKARCQQVWVVPWSGAVHTVEMTPELVASRLTGLDRGVIPDDSETLTAQVDVHVRTLYWVVTAVGPEGIRSIVDYGIHTNPNPEINGPKVAIRLGLEQLKEKLTTREWKRADGRAFKMDVHLVDGGYEQGIVLSFVLEAGNKWRVSKGMGNEYRRPERGPGVFVGDHWYDSAQTGCEESNNRPWPLIIAETNSWLHVVHSGFAALTFLDDRVTRRPGSIALFGNDPGIHLTPVDRTISRSAFAIQICGWKWQKVESKKRGTQMEWVYQHDADHFLDCTYGTCVADKVIRAYHPRFRAPEPPPPPPPEPMMKPGGRPWVTPLEHWRNS